MPAPAYCPLSLAPLLLPTPSSFQRSDRFPPGVLPPSHPDRALTLPCTDVHAGGGHPPHARRRQPGGARALPAGPLVAPGASLPLWARRNSRACVRTGAVCVLRLEGPCPQCMRVLLSRRVLPLCASSHALGPLPPLSAHPLCSAFFAPLVSCPPQDLPAPCARLLRRLPPAAFSSRLWPLRCQGAAEPFACGLSSLRPRRPRRVPCLPLPCFLSYDHMPLADEPFAFGGCLPQAYPSCPCRSCMSWPAFLENLPAPCR